MEDRRTPLAPVPFADVEGAVRAVEDPEIPVLSIDDLGIVRGTVATGETTESGAPVLLVTITPTYSGCPAVEAIAAGIRSVAARLGWQARVETVLSPAWTTDWMSAHGREQLRRFGIAPPGLRDAAGGGPVGLDLRVRRAACPQCGSEDTEEVSRFGGTACKALRRCRACFEPFEEFKTL